MSRRSVDAWIFSHALKGPRNVLDFVPGPSSPMERAVPAGVCCLPSPSGTRAYVLQPEVFSTKATSVRGRRMRGGV